MLDLLRYWYLKIADLNLHFEVPAVYNLHVQYMYSKPRYTAQLNEKVQSLAQLKFVRCEKNQGYSFFLIKIGALQVSVVHA